MKNCVKSVSIDNNESNELLDQVASNDNMLSVDPVLSNDNMLSNDNLLSSVMSSTSFKVCIFDFFVRKKFMFDLSRLILGAHFSFLLQL